MQTLIAYIESLVVIARDLLRQDSCDAFATTIHVSFATSRVDKSLAKPVECRVHFACLKDRETGLPRLFYAHSVEPESDYAAIKWQEKSLATNDLRLGLCEIGVHMTYKEMQKYAERVHRLPAVKLVEHVALERMSYMPRSVILGVEEPTVEIALPLALPAAQETPESPETLETPGICLRRRLLLKEKTRGRMLGRGRGEISRPSKRGNRGGQTLR